MKMAALGWFLLGFVLAWLVWKHKEDAPLPLLMAMIIGGAICAYGGIMWFFHLSYFGA